MGVVGFPTSKLLFRQIHELGLSLRRIYNTWNKRFGRIFYEKQKINNCTSVVLYMDDTLQVGQLSGGGGGAYFGRECSLIDCWFHLDTCLFLVSSIQAAQVTILTRPKWLRARLAIAELNIVGHTTPYQAFLVSHMLGGAWLFGCCISFDCVFE